jgi:hypothetical protein
VASRHLVYRVLADPRFVDKLGLANVAAYAFLEVDIRSAYRSGRAGVFTYLANLALFHPLDTPRRKQCYQPKCRAEGTNVATIKAADKHRG